MSQNGYGEKRLRRTSRPKQSGLEERSDYNVLTLGDLIIRRRISEPHFRAPFPTHHPTQNFNPYDVWIWYVSQRKVKFSRRLHSSTPGGAPPSVSQKVSRTNNGSNLKSAWLVSISVSGAPGVRRKDKHLNCCGSSPPNNRYSLQVGVCFVPVLIAKTTIGKSMCVCVCVCVQSVCVCVCLWQIS